MATEARVVLCTLPDADTAATIAKQLVADKLAACVNIVGPIRSIYSWKGEVCDDAEWLAVIKTTAARLDALSDRVDELHPYECPEVIALPIVGGLAAYLDWVAASTQPPSAP